MWVFLSSGCEIEATECVDQQTLCTAAPSLISNRSESEAVRGTLQNIYFREISVAKKLQTT